MKIEIDVETDDIVIGSLKSDYAELKKNIDQYYLIRSLGETTEKEELEFKDNLRFFDGVKNVLSYYMGSIEFNDLTGENIDEL